MVAATNMCIASRQPWKEFHDSCFLVHLYTLPFSSKILKITKSAAAYKIQINMFDRLAWDLYSVSEALS